jgi:diadenosine tetraphosphatase ApaH/serine/threonine PP2A family protein phosphatase
MRYAIIADVHANIEALGAVLTDIERRGGVDAFWCLGDVVGYGPDPHQCLETLRRYPHICVAGNHDWAAIGKVSLDDFNPDAAAACRWTAQQLTDEEVEYLESLPLVVERDDFTLVHGSPREPIWEYLLSVSSARENFAHFNLPFCLVGHTHIPVVFRLNEDGGCSSGQFRENVGLLLGKSRLIVNPGGVGQPRDGDPRASYAILDQETRMARLYRIPYDVETTQAKMVRHNLPLRLVSRLSRGV